MDLDADDVLGAMHDQASRLYRQSATLKKQEKTVHLEKTRLAAQLANIEKEEREMKAQLAGVKREITVTEQRIATFNSLSLLLGRVPVEIWRLIFSWHREIVRFYVCHWQRWKIGHVCHKWREIAHGDAYLWNDIFIHTSWSPSPSLAALEKQLELSRSATLQVAFQGSMLDDRNLSWGLLNILARHSSRWERFDVEWVGDMDVFSALSNIAGRLDRLRHLELLSLPTEESWKEYAGTWPVAMLDAFRTAPLLEDVFLTSKDDSYPVSPVVRLPPTVKRLQIAAQPKDIVRALHDAPDIVELDIREVDDEGISVDGGFVFMNTIQRLHLVHSRLSNRMICQLRTPTLQNLSVEGSVTELPQFLTQSGCRLQRLTLQSPSGGAEAVLAVLRTQQELPYLRLDCCFRDPPYQKTMEMLMPQLTVSTGRATVCPNLMSLDIRMTWKLPQVHWEDAFCEMVESRRGSLKIVRMEGMHGLSAANKRRLESMQQQGITVIKGR